MLPREFGALLGALNDAELIDPETGTVTWPGGGDLAPDVLYERVTALPSSDSAAHG